jgi:hypothetical protein
MDRSGQDALCHPVSAKGIPRVAYPSPSLEPKAKRYLKQDLNWSVNDL